MNKNDIMQIIHWVIRAIVVWYIFTGRAHERFKDIEHKNNDYYLNEQRRWKSDSENDD